MIGTSRLVSDACVSLSLERLRQAGGAGDREGTFRCMHSRGSGLVYLAGEAGLAQGESGHVIRPSVAVIED